MQRTFQNLFNFVQDNLGKDSSVIGLCGLKKEVEYNFIDIPQNFTKTYIQDVRRNYLLI